MTSLFSNVLNNLRLCSATNVASLVPASVWSLTSVRTNVRNHFPKPKEVKRWKVHGYWYRLKTTNGKKIIMRRMLKGNHVLAHGW